MGLFVMIRLRLSGMETGGLPEVHLLARMQALSSACIWNEPCFNHVSSLPFDPLLTRT
jgi:hypothetical protein